MEMNYYQCCPSNYCPVNPCISEAEVQLMSTMRMLWEQHVMWTRLVILSIIAGSPDEDVNTKRLLQNPGDFAQALRPFYGEEKAREFKDLFTSHLVIAAELVKAATAGKNAAAADAEERWYANAKEIAAFLASINPYWSKEVWQSMLREHLALTKSEAVDILTKDYASAVRVYDEIEKQALMMADVMTGGIISSFYLLTK